MKRIFVSALAGFFFANLSIAQNLDYAQMMGDSSKSFAEIQKAFNLNWAGQDRNEKGRGWKAFKRWEYFHRNRLNASGGTVTPYTNYVEYKKYFGENNTSSSSQKKAGNNNNIMTAGTWSYIGPPGGVSNNGGAGRVPFVRFDPTNSNTVYAGSPAGGLWKSTTGGNNFTVMADQIASLGCTDLVIDPTNTNIIYLATGDGDANDTYSIGVLKTTNGGTTWNTTGLNYSVATGATISKMLINPNNHLEIWAATNTGLMKTTDGGVNWIIQKNGSFKDIEFRPNHPNTVYASSNGSFFVTRNGGVTWTQVPLNLVGSVGRTAIGVTDADSNYIYVLAGKPGTGAATDYAFLGLSKSTDGGQTFTVVCTTPNILGANASGSSQGGQAWYDLAISVSPTNKNNLVIGGVNVWKSANGGTSFTNASKWNGNPYVHADVHALEYAPGSNTTIYAGCDGGVFKSTNSGTAWSDVSTGLQIAQQYRLGVSQTNSALTLTGWQDNGTNLHNGTACDEVDFGDGFECIINRANASTMYAELYYGSIDKSTNTGTSFTTTIANSGGTAGTVDEDGDWDTPYIQHPTASGTLLVGKSQVYRTTNSGSTWSTVGSIGNGVILTSLAYSPSNPNYIYASSGSGLWVSTNGTSFTNRSSTLASDITSMAVHPLYPSTMWITSSGYTAGTKVFVTTDAGVTWTNCSSGLPNVPCHSIVYQAGSNGGLYVGNDIGVFYRDSTMTNWIAYSYGMPNVIVHELEIQVSAGKLRAATYGRGLWETDLYVAPTSAPVAAFTSNMTTACKGQNVDFYDQSANLPYSWSWTFTGGTPVTSTTQFPTVSYSVAGTYPVSLTVTNQAGSNSVTTNSYIVVNPLPAIYAGADTTICKGDTIQLNVTGGTSAYVWAASTSLSNVYISNPKAFPIVNKVFTVTAGDANGCKASDALTVTVKQPFATPTISAAGNQLTVTPGTAAYNIQWYYNGSAIAGGTASVITADSVGNYTVMVADTFGCFSLTSATFSYVGIDQMSGLSNWNFFPNPSKGKINISVGNNYSGNIRINVYSSEGKLVEAENKTVTANETFLLKAELTPGLYFLEVRENNNKLLGTRRIVVAKE